MDALRRSIDAEQPAPSTKKAPSKTSAERSERKATGKAPAKAPAKKGRTGARKAG